MTGMHALATGSSVNDNAIIIPIGSSSSLAE